MPRIDNLKDFVGTAKFVAKIKGYYQIALQPLAREKTVFVTPDGLYQSTVFPFGLRNAPATFQRMINNLVSDLP